MADNRTHHIRNNMSHVARYMQAMTKVGLPFRSVYGDKTMATGFNLKTSWTGGWVGLPSHLDVVSFVKYTRFSKEPPRECVVLV